MAEHNEAQTLDSSHGHAKRPYIRIFWWLCAVTFVEVAIAELFINAGPPLDVIVVAVLVLLSFAKIALVAMYYMHLYGDNPLLTYMFLVPVPFVALIVVALILDLIARGGAIAP